LEDATELELIAQSKQGNQHAIAELVRRHYTASLHLAHGILRRTEDAQDAVQVAYFLAIRQIEHFRGESSFKTWINRIVVNCCLLELREPRRRMTWVPVEEQGPELFPSRAPSPEKSAWCREISSAFSAAVAKLPENLREAYTLFTISGLSLREVAEALGLSIPATKTRLFRARAGMRVSLQPVWSISNSGSACEGCFDVQSSR